MFPTSSQKKYWTFADENTLTKFRARANREFIKRFAPSDMTEEERKNHFLTPEQEKILYNAYEFRLADFCTHFQPPMPPGVVGTTYHYFKRFYLVNSVMDYHPKDILITCAYLACKVEEFNVSIHQFVANLDGDREKYIQLILNSELMLMSELKFHLTVHNPYRPIEGFFIDIKTRHPILDPEAIRPEVESFIKKVLFTDVFLIYAPSQIALAAILHGASRSKKHLDSYVTDVLITDQSTLPTVIEAIRNIRLMVRSLKDPPGPGREVLRSLEEKLEKCRNMENNPDSPIYQVKMENEMADEDLDQSFKTNFNRISSSQQSEQENK